MLDLTGSYYADTYFDNRYGPDFTRSPIIQDYAEFSSQSVADVVEKMRNWQSLTKPDYHTLKDKFYSDSTTYIYDILSSAPVLEMRANLVHQFITHGMMAIKEHPGTEFLDFGAGIGVMCEIATLLGKHATHVDVKSHHLDFARWRYKKNDLPVKVIEIGETDFWLPRQYDIVFTDAVWEHLPPTMQVPHVQKLTNAVKDAGFLFFLFDSAGESEDMPMHYNVDIGEIFNVLFAAGLKCIYPAIVPNVPFKSNSTVWVRL